MYVYHLQLNQALLLHVVAERRGQTGQIVRCAVFCRKVIPGDGRLFQEVWFISEGRNIVVSLRYNVFVMYDQRH